MSGPSTRRKRSGTFEEEQAHANSFVDALHEFVRQSTVPMILDTDAGAGLQGTGTFFRVRGRTYLVTAAHVLAKQDLSDVCIPDRSSPRGASLVPLQGAQVHVSRSTKDDVAVVALDAAGIAERLGPDWLVFSLADLRGRLDRVKWFIVAGFPAATAALTDGLLRAPLEAMLTQVTTQRSGGGFDRRKELILRHKEHWVGRDRQATESPRLHGISGSSVWAITERVQDRGIWSPRRQVRICAVQSAYCHGSYIRAKRWSLVAKVFDTIDPEAAAEIRASLRRGT